MKNHTDIEFIEDSHEYFIKKIKYPSNSEIIKDAGFMNYYRRGEDAMNRGKAIHMLFADSLMQRVDYARVSGEGLILIEGLQRFIGNEDITFVDCETICGSVEERFAGKYDALFSKEGKTILVDWKSGEPAKWHKYQVAGYMLLSGAVSGWIVYIDKGFKKVEIDYEKCVAGFRMMRDLYYMKRED
jgi:hypothetical protein